MLGGALTLVAMLFMLSVPNIMAQGPCTADFDCDLDVDAHDVIEFLNQFGRDPYYNPCPGSRCPITCEGTLSAEGRWCDQGDGTVKDMTTGLVWLKKADWGGMYPLWADFSFPDAHGRAAGLWDGSFAAVNAGLSDGSVEGDWRLPTKTDFFDLTHGNEPVNSFSMQFFTGVETNYYWSSSAVGDEYDRAWVVWMGFGYDPQAIVKRFSQHVWPVRGSR